MWQQNERCHCPCVISDPIAAVARESKEDRAIFMLALSDCRNAVALRTLGDDAVFEPCCFNAKIAVFANCFATDNPTALKVNGDRLMATLWTTKVAGNEDFGDKFVKSFERFNDAFASLIEAVKFAVGVAHRGNDLSALVNSPKQRKQTLSCYQCSLTNSVGCANLFLGHCGSTPFTGFCPAREPPLPRCRFYYDTAQNKMQHSNANNFQNPPKWRQKGSKLVAF
jgi:hypothetical protein